MRLFLVKLVLFLAPLVAAWTYVEWRIRQIPTQYTVKAELLKQRAATARVLVLGSSLEFEGISPREFDCEGLNMASQAQTPFLDGEIVRRHARNMPELRLVIQGVAYPSLECQLSDSHLQSALYLSRHYLGTGLDSGASFWDARTFSMIACFGQRLVLQQMFTGFQQSWLLGPIDEYGWSQSERGMFDPASEPLAMVSMRIIHSYMKPHHIPENLQALERMIDHLRKRNVEVVLVTTPVAPALRKFVEPERLERLRAALAHLQARFGITHMDYSLDPRFDINADFANINHLNGQGAAKYSRILNDEVIRPRGVCAGAPGERPE